MKVQNAAVASQNIAGSIEARVVAEPEVAWFDGLLADKHYLGAGRSVGDYLRQVVEVDGIPAALLVWGPACYALNDRDNGFRGARRNDWSA